MSSIIAAISAQLEDQKKLGIDHPGEDLSIWSLIVDTDLMAHSQLINVQLF